MVTHYSKYTLIPTCNETMKKFLRETDFFSFANCLQIYQKINEISGSLSLYIKACGIVIKPGYISFDFDTK